MTEPPTAKATAAVPPDRNRSSVLLYLAAGALGLALAFVVYAVHGSPLYQKDPILRFYNLLTGPPLGLWCLDRFQSRATLSRTRSLLDAAVVIVAAARSLALVPLVSGHALLFVYFIGTSRMRAPRLCAALFLVPAAAIKIWAWHDWWSLLAGIVAGGLAARLWRAVGR